MSLLSVEEAAARLGVKPSTLYAYVSRGHLRSRRRAGSRRSYFDASEVEELARRGRPRRTTRPAALDFVIETSLTTIGDHDVCYRGRSALELARTATFEEVAEWLWSVDADQTPTPWAAVPVDLPNGLGPRDLLRLSVVLAAAADPIRDDQRPSAVAQRARTLIATMTASLGGRGDHRAVRLHLPGRATPLRSTIAGRLWSALTPKRANPHAVVALNAALVLLADHELAVSTLAARVAASARADSYAIVLAGLGPLAGPLHGGASYGAYQLVDAAITDGADSAIASFQATHRLLPGFGHRVYVNGDPRARVLLAMLRDAYPGHVALNAADQLIALARRRVDVEPNIDFSLAVLAASSGMGPQAGETIFTVARTAGWIAHALEEYRERPLRYRARAVPRAAQESQGQPSRSR